MSSVGVIVPQDHEQLLSLCRVEVGWLANTIDVEHSRAIMSRLG